MISAAVSVEHLIHLSNEGMPTAVPLRKTGLPEQSRRFVDRWLDVTKSNLLFSKGAILVEGIAEAIVVPELARIVLHAQGKGRDSLDDYGVSVINLGGIYFKHFMQLFCDVTGAQPGGNVPIRCAGLTDNDPPKSFSAIDDGEGREKPVPFLPHAEDHRQGNNPALELQGPINQSQFARLFAGKYKTFEYDIALEGGNLTTMLNVAADLWPVQDGKVAGNLREDAKRDFASMSSADKAPFAGALLARLDSEEIGKGLYAQALADALLARPADFVVPEYIRLAILWACGLEEGQA